MAEPGDEGEDDFSSLLAPRFRARGTSTETSSTNRPSDTTTPPIEAPEPVVAPAVAPPTEDLPADPALSEPPSPAPLTVEAATAIVGNERFLPLPEPVLVPPTEAGPMRIFVPAGTPVHVIEGGRVSDTTDHIAGEVTIRVDGDRFYRYRRLLPSSICVEPGETVGPGSIIGVVGSPIDDHPSCLVVGLQSGAGEWSDLYRLLVGLPDPGELGLSVGLGDGQWVDPLATDAGRESSTP